MGHLAFSSSLRYCYIMGQVEASSIRRFYVGDVVEAKIEVVELQLNTPYAVIEIGTSATGHYHWVRLDGIDSPLFSEEFVKPHIPKDKKSENAYLWDLVAK